ncbi:MAG: hypothetical protein ACP5HZ_01740 [Ferrimicrobium sp.]|uniref:hypothetical protein n=1 Tax=Ferrimicrobium sp. TaxID=2926050 RepID=UPI00262AEE10|nr:hypothetical protein [Ferrimicrobium sp.]
MDALCPVCREKELVIIELGVGDHEVVLVSCAACGSRWWRRDGFAAQVGEVVELAATSARSGNRRKSGRPAKTAS